MKCVYDDIERIHVYILNSGKRNIRLLQPISNFPIQGRLLHFNPRAKSSFTLRDARKIWKPIVGPILRDRHPYSKALGQYFNKPLSGRFVPALTRQPRSVFGRIGRSNDRSHSTLGRSASRVVILAVV